MHYRTLNVLVQPLRLVPGEENEDNSFLFVRFVTKYTSSCNIGYTGSYVFNTYFAHSETHIQFSELAKGVRYLTSICMYVQMDGWMGVVLLFIYITYMYLLWFCIDLHTFFDT